MYALLQNVCTSCGQEDEPICTGTFSGLPRPFCNPVLPLVPFLGTCFGGCPDGEEFTLDFNLEESDGNLTTAIAPACQECGGEDLPPCKLSEPACATGTELSGDTCAACGDADLPACLSSDNPCPTTPGYAASRSP